MNIERPALLGATHHKYKPQVLCSRPLQCVTLLPIRGFRTGFIGLGKYALLDEDIADEAVDDVGADGGVSARPQHHSGRGQDLESIQHGVAAGQGLVVVPQEVRAL
jgi:hypothetical protein